MKNFRTIWISGDWAEIQQIDEFAERYRLDELNSVAVRKEITNFLVGNYFKLSGVPFAAVYSDNQLVKEYRSKVDFSELISMNYGTYDFANISLEVNEK